MGSPFGSNMLGVPYLDPGAQAAMRQRQLGTLSDAQLQALVAKGDPNAVAVMAARAGAKNAAMSHAAPTSLSPVATTPPTPTVPPPPVIPPAPQSDIGLSDLIQPTQLAPQDVLNPVPGAGPAAGGMSIPVPGAKPEVPPAPVPVPRPTPQPDSIASSIGPMVAAPQGGIVLAPPSSPEEFAQRKSGWRAWLDRASSDPNMMRALFALGVNLMQPIPPGQTAAGHFGRAAMAGLDYASAAAAADRAYKLKEASTQSEITTREATVAQGARRLDIEDRRVKSLIEASKIDDAATKLKIQQMGLNVEKIKLDVARELLAAQQKAGAGKLNVTGNAFDGLLVTQTSHSGQIVNQYSIQITDQGVTRVPLVEDGKVLPLPRQGAPGAAPVTPDPNATVRPVPSEQSKTLEGVTESAKSLINEINALPADQRQTYIDQSVEKLKSFGWDFTGVFRQLPDGRWEITGTPKAIDQRPGRSDIYKGVGMH